MTVYRKPGSIEDALRQAVQELSPQEIKQATGLTAAKFRKTSNPLDGTDLELADAAALDAALIARGKSPVFIEVMQEITAAKLAELQGDERPETDFARQLVRLDIESGTLAKEIDTALADDHVDQQERRRIARAAQNVMDHAREIRDAAEPPHLSGNVTQLRAEASA